MFLALLSGFGKFQPYLLLAGLALTVGQLSGRSGCFPLYRWSAIRAR